LRCFDDNDCSRLLKNIRAAIPIGGKLLCFEIVMPPERDDPARALADLTARVVYGGQDRTEEDFRSLFRDCGFALQRVIATEGTTVGLEAVPV